MQGLFGVIMRMLLILVPLYVAGRIMFRGEGVGRRFKIMRVVGSFVGILVGNGIIMAGLIMLTIFAEETAARLDPNYVTFLISGSGNISGGNLLTYIFLLIFITAFIHYGVRGLLRRRWPRLALDDDECMTFEYFIQWVTIYLVVYQCFFEGFKTFFQWVEEGGATGIQGIFEIALSPSNINLVIQPLLIAAWVLVVLERFARSSSS